MSTFFLMCYLQLLILQPKEKKKRTHKWKKHVKLTVMSRCVKESNGCTIIVCINDPCMWVLLSQHLKSTF